MPFEGKTFSKAVWDFEPNYKVVEPKDYYFMASVHLPKSCYKYVGEKGPGNE